MLVEEGIGFSLETLCEETGVGDEAAAIPGCIVVKTTGLGAAAVPGCTEEESIEAVEAAAMPGCVDVGPASSKETAGEGPSGPKLGRGLGVVFGSMEGGEEISISTVTGSEFAGGGELGRGRDDTRVGATGEEAICIVDLTSVSEGEEEESVDKLTAGVEAIFSTDFLEEKKFFTRRDSIQGKRESAGSATKC